MSKKLFDQALAAKTLIESLATDDDELSADMVEGETEFVECVHRVLRRMEDDKMLVNGIAMRIDELNERKKRLQKRVEATKASLEVAMIVATAPPIETPIGTVSRKKPIQKLEIVDEHKLPAKYWKRGQPTIDKKTLTADLKNEERVPGARLIEGSETVQIRTK